MTAPPADRSAGMPAATFPATRKETNRCPTVLGQEATREVVATTLLRAGEDHRVRDRRRRSWDAPARPARAEGAGGGSVSGCVAGRGS